MQYIIITYYVYARYYDIIYYYNSIIVVRRSGHRIGLDRGTTSPDASLITTTQSINKLQYYVIILILLDDKHERTVRGLRSVHAVISHTVVIVIVYDIPTYGCDTK